MNDKPLIKYSFNVSQPFYFATFASSIDAEIEKISKEMLALELELMLETDVSDVSDAKQMLAKIFK